MTSDRHEDRDPAEGMKWPVCVARALVPGFQRFINATAMISVLFNMERKAMVGITAEIRRRACVTLLHVDGRVCVCVCVRVPCESAGFYLCSLIYCD